MILSSLIINIFKVRFYEKTEIMLMNVFTGQYTKNTIQNINARLKTAIKNNYLKNCFYKNKKK